MKKYTYLDFEELRKCIGSMTPPSDPNDPMNVKRADIINYFIEHPKELADNGIFHYLGYSEERIVQVLKGESLSIVCF